MRETASAPPGPTGYFVDTREKLEAFLAAIDPLIHEGLATLEKADIRFYRSREVVS